MRKTTFSKLVRNKGTRNELRRRQLSPLGSLSMLGRSTFSAFKCHSTLRMPKRLRGKYATSWKTTSRWVRIAAT